MAARTDNGGVGKGSVGSRVADAVSKAATAVSEAAGKLVGEATGGGSDERRENAEEFAERANAQRDRASADDALGDYGRAQANQVASFKQMPQDGPYQLRFADGETFIDGAITVERKQVKDRELGATYEAPVEFPPEGELAMITEAWLIDRGGDAVRCAIGPPPLPAGGGHAAKIPAGNLLF